MNLTSKLTLLLGAAAFAAAAAVPDDVQAATGTCWKACLLEVGRGLVPPCLDRECACRRASEFDGPADSCVIAKCPPGELQELHCAACDCDPGYRCERCPRA